MKKLDIANFENLEQSVKIEGENNLRTLNHLHWKQWKDGGVPRSKMGILRLLEYIDEQKFKKICVHCYAGINISK